MALFIPLANLGAKHRQQGTKYRLKIVHPASKGIDGFVVEVTGDTKQEVMNDVQALYEAAEAMTKTEGK